MVINLSRKEGESLKFILTHKIDAKYLYNCYSIVLKGGLKDWYRIRVDECDNELYIMRKRLNKNGEMWTSPRYLKKSTVVRDVNLALLQGIKIEVVPRILTDEVIKNRDAKALEKRNSMYDEFTYEEGIDHEFPLKHRVTEEYLRNVHGFLVELPTKNYEYVFFSPFMKNDKIFVDEQKSGESPDSEEWFKTISASEAVIKINKAFVKGLKIHVYPRYNNEETQKYRNYTLNGRKVTARKVSTKSKRVVRKPAIQLPLPRG